MRDRGAIYFIIRAAWLALACVLSHPGAAAEPSCEQTAGAQRARTYVEQCLEVSPATHPPCNAANSCELILDEIQRGCAMLGNDAPGFCKDYHSAR